MGVRCSVTCTCACACASMARCMILLACVDTTLLNSTAEGARAVTMCVYVCMCVCVSVCVCMRERALACVCESLTQLFQFHSGAVVQSLLAPRGASLVSISKLQDVDNSELKVFEW